MRINALWYLAEASFCLAVLALAYRLLLARLTCFAWNRAYLLGALAAGAALPLVAFPGLAAWLAGPAGAPAAGALPLRWHLAAPAARAAPGAPAAYLEWLLLALLAGYGLGALRKLWGVARGLAALRQLARRHPSTNLGTCTVVQLPGPGLPAFSFGRFVFLSPPHARLSAAERQQLLQHEQVHIRQRHTLDLLFAQALGVVFWFNGAVPYFSRQLKTVHEYLADAAVARTQGSPTGYGELLIKLAARQPPFALAHAFANKQVFNRIRMLTQPPSSPMQKLRFVFILPVAAFAWAAVACADSPTAAALGAPAATSPAPPAAGTGRIGRISWRGNAAVSTAELNGALGLKTGDPYDSLAVNKRLDVVTSRYMDHGYLFFQLTPAATRRADGTTDLAFAIAEGRPARLGTITIVGSPQTTSKTALLKLLPLRTGEAFSRANLIETSRLLAQQGEFDPQKIGINPKPVMRPALPTDLVDIDLVLVPKARP